MIEEGSNTNAIIVVLPTTLTPASVFSTTGISLTGTEPRIEFVLLDVDQTAAVSTLTFVTSNVSKVKVTLLDKTNAEVKTTEVYHCLSPPNCSYRVKLLNTFYMKILK